jgi:hypothetical protein
VINPWPMRHKTRIGQPGMPSMPSWLQYGGDDQGGGDIGRYAQVSLCVGWPDGDLDGDGDTDGDDIQRFADAVVAGSSAIEDVCPGDFDLLGTVDPQDV